MATDEDRKQRYRRQARCELYGHHYGSDGQCKKCGFYSQFFDRRKDRP